MLSPKFSQALSQLKAFPVARENSKDDKPLRPDIILDVFFYSNSTLRDGVIFLSLSPAFRVVFQFIYRLQLWAITLVFSKQDHIVGVILRRPEVLNDASPGISDYDISCIFDSKNESREKVLASLQHRHRFLKQLLPVLGETKFIECRDMPVHLEAETPGYGGGNNLHYLYRGSTLSQSFPRPSAIAIRRRIAACFTECLSPLLLNETRNRRTSLGILKEAERITWLLQGLDGSPLPPLRYRHRNGQKYDDPKDTLNILRQNLSKAVNTSNPPPSSPFSIRIEGDGEPIPEGLRKAAARIERMVPAKVTLTSRRPYKFNWSVILRVEDDDWKPGHYSQAISELKPFTRILSPAHLLVLGPVGSCISVDWDSLANLLVGQHRFHTEKGKIGIPLTNKRVVDKNAFRLELAETLILLPSILRRQDTNFLLDVFFGQLTALRVMLETGVFYSDFESLRNGPLQDIRWTPGQKAIVHLYRNGDQTGLDRLPTMEVWNLFQNLISEETLRVRRILSQS